MAAPIVIAVADPVPEGRPPEPAEDTTSRGHDHQPAPERFKFDCSGLCNTLMRIRRFGEFNPET